VAQRGFGACAPTRRRPAPRRAGDVGLEQPLLEQRRHFSAAREHHDLGIAVERPRVEVHRAEADGVVCHHRLGVHHGARQLPELHVRGEQVLVPVLERGRSRTAVGLRRDDNAHLQARRAAARVRSTMSWSVRYGFITSRRSRAAPICSLTGPARAGRRRGGSRTSQGREHRLYGLQRPARREVAHSDAREGVPEGREPAGDVDADQTGEARRRPRLPRADS
jgi:hypothetical protein